MNNHNINYEEIYLKYIDIYEKKGKELICLCPFHEERTPSFNVNLLTGQYHCFGCSAKGNAITFVAQMENITTKEAWKKIAEDFNLKYTLEDYSKEKNLPLDFLQSIRLKGC